MQIALIAFALFGFNFGLVEYSDANHAPAYLVCVDDGFDGVCYGASGEVESAYYCPEGCSEF
jgi:hypothetical protein